MEIQRKRLFGIYIYDTLNRNTYCFEKAKFIYLE